MKLTLTLFLTIILIAGCATTGVYYSKLDDFIRAKRYAEADALVEKSYSSIYGQKDELLYHLDRGYLLHLAGDYKKSNIEFEKAKRIAEYHFTKSITAEASTILVSDNMRPYYGEDFERALIHIFSALNYILLNDNQSALVEARQVDHFLNTIQTNYRSNITYQEDAFARYLMGLIYEDAGYLNDAYISYRKSLEAYNKYHKNYNTPVPKMLVRDAISSAKRLGFKDRVEEIKKNWGGRETQSDIKANSGEVVLVLYKGISPRKIDSFFEISFGKAWGYVRMTEFKEDEKQQAEKASQIARSILADEHLVMAFPKYVPTPYFVRDVRCEVFDDAGVRINVEDNEFELVQDIGKIAMKNLEERIDRIRIKTIVRATIKYVLSRQLSSEIEKRSQDRLLGWLSKKLLTGIASATELADKRSWRTLPDKIYVSRISLPAGNYKLKLTFYDKYGYKIGNKATLNVEVKPKKRTFKVYRVSR